MMRNFLLTVTMAGLLSGPAMAQGAEGSGAQLFEAQCAACHNVGGTGTPGLAPPLDRPAFWQALGDKAPKYLSGVITKGLNMTITVRGNRYAGMLMPPVSGVSDDELAGLANWVLASLGKTGHTVSAEDIASARAGELTNDHLKAMRPLIE